MRSKRCDTRWRRSRSPSMCAIADVDSESTLCSRSSSSHPLRLESGVASWWADSRAMPAHTRSRSARLRVRSVYNPARKTNTSSDASTTGITRRLVISWLSPKCTMPMPRSTTGGFMRSRTGMYCRTLGSESGALNGRFAAAVGTPLSSVTITGTPSASMLRASSSSASSPASGRGSASARNTRAYICPDRPASRRNSSTTRREKRMYAPSSSASNTPRMSTGARPRIRLLGWAQEIAAEVRAEDVRDRDGAVGPLVVLEEGDDRARECKRRAVERMYEARLLSRRGPVANVRATSLKVAEVAARRDLEPLPHAGCPQLEIVGLGRREARIAGGEQQHAIRKLEELQHALGVRRQYLELRCGTFRRDEAYELDLVELMDADQPTRVFSRVAGLAPEARRVRGERIREHARLQNLASQQIRERHLGGGDEKEIVLGAVGVILEFRKLPRAGHRFASDEKRHPCLLVTLLPRVQVEQERHERADETRTLTPQHDEPGAGDLRTSGQIEDAELRTELPMRAHVAAGTRLAPRAHDPVALLAAVGHIGQRNVRQLQENVVELLFPHCEIGFERLDLKAERAHVANQLAGALLLLLEARDFLAHRIAFRFLLLRALDQGTALHVQQFRPLDARRERVELTPAAHPLAQRLRIFPQQPQVVHGQRVGMPSRNEMKPQFGSLRMRYHMVRGVCGATASS